MAALLFEVFDLHPCVEIVGQAWTVEEATRLAAAQAPDLVVIASGVVLREDAVDLADRVYQANPNAVVIVTASMLPNAVQQKLLDVCAIPLATEICDLPHSLEELVPDLRAPATITINRA